MAGRKTIQAVVDHIWPQRKELQKCGFDFPDYGNLPKRISYSMSSEFVDAIQETLWEWEHGSFRTKRNFHRRLTSNLRNLGERIR